MGDSQPLQLLWAEIALCWELQKPFVGSKKERHTHFLLSSPPCPHFWFTLTHFWFSYPNMWSKSREGDSGSHYNQLVGSSSLHLLFAGEPGGLVKKQGRVKQEKAICLQVRAKDNWGKGWYQEKNHAYVSTWPFRSKLLVYPDAAVGKRELLAQERSYAKCDSLP